MSKVSHSGYGVGIFLSTLADVFTLHVGGVKVRGGVDCPSMDDTLQIICQFSGERKLK